MPQNMPPLYIAFEGGDGGGKSTQVKLLASKIGQSAVPTREPGGTYIGARLRSLLLDPGVKIDPMTEVYLMAADRAQHCADVIEPGLAAGRVIISDRSFLSSVAYQGAGRELGEDRVLEINLANPGLILPDLVFFITQPSPEELARRMNRDLDRFEQEYGGFQDRVAASFGSMAAFMANHPKLKQITTHTIDPYRDGELKSTEDMSDEIFGLLPK